MGQMNDAMRKCARKYGKTNFFFQAKSRWQRPVQPATDHTAQPGYVARGSTTAAVKLSNNSQARYFLRDDQYGALDSAAFHYSCPEPYTIPGMDGKILRSGYDTPRNWVQAWNVMMLSNDFVNANTGKFDPRHM